MKCQRCDSGRVASATAKCSDLCGISINHFDESGYVPGDMGIGGGDYIKINWCLECGQIQGEWPLDKSEAELFDPKACKECKETEYLDEIGECHNCGEKKRMWCPCCDNQALMTKTSNNLVFCDVRTCRKTFTLKELEEAQP